MASDTSTETALLQAVAERLRDYIELDSLEAQVEHDEQAPVAVGEKYFCVLTGGLSPGPTEAGNVAILDELVSVDITVIIRCAAVQRDKRRDVFLGNVRSLNAYTRKVQEAIHGNYTELINVANTYIRRESGSTDGFIEPLRFAGTDQRPRLVPGTTFAARPEEKFAGLARTVRFRNARRIQVI